MSTFRWTGPRPEDWADASETRLKAPVPPSRWPYGPPAFHQEACSLHRRGLFCDCVASAADGDGWGEVAHATYPYNDLP